MSDGLPKRLFYPDLPTLIFFGIIVFQRGTSILQFFVHLRPLRSQRFLCLCFEIAFQLFAKALLFLLDLALKLLELAAFLFDFLTFLLQFRLTLRYQFWMPGPLFDNVLVAGLQIPELLLKLLNVHLIPLSSFFLNRVEILRMCFFERLCCLLPLGLKLLLQRLIETRFKQLPSPPLNVGLELLMGQNLALHNFFKGTMDLSIVIDPIKRGRSAFLIPLDALHLDAEREHGREGLCR